MSKKPVFTNPPNPLKEKVGEGGIPAHLIKQCQTFLENNPVDFTPYARRFLEDLEIVKGSIEKRNIEPDMAMKQMVNIIMQLKSNGSMFHYQLISMVSDVMLRFLEKAAKLDVDFLDIFNVYINILKIIINKKLTGSAGREGYALTQELHNACLRYYSRYGISH